MNERPTRLLVAAAALSAFAAMLTSTATAYVPEGATVPVAIYAASTSPVTSTQQLGEIGAWAVPSVSRHNPQLLRHTSVGEKLAEIGAWAVPSVSQQEPQTPLAAHPAIPNVDPATFDGYRG